MGAEKGPKYFPDIQIPSVPDDMVAVRFHGSLAFIPAAGKGEAMIGKTRFTERQMAALRELEKQITKKAKSDSEPRDSTILYISL